MADNSPFSPNTTSGGSLVSGFVPFKTPVGPDSTHFSGDKKPGSDNNSNPAAEEPKVKKPSDVTGDPYDDHPGMVYSCDGGVSTHTSGMVGAGMGTAVGTFFSEFGGDTPVGPSTSLLKPNRSPSKTELMMTGGLGGSLGYAVGSTKWFNCYANNASNMWYHPSATLVPVGEPDWGATARD